MKKETTELELRDEFAIAALQAYSLPDLTPDYVAEKCYELADAMIHERNKSK